MFFYLKNLTPNYRKLRPRRPIKKLDPRIKFFSLKYWKNWAAIGDFLELLRYNLVFNHVKQTMQMTRSQTTKRNEIMEPKLTYCLTLLQL